MRLGCVTGAVWSSKKCSTLSGISFLRVDSGGMEVVAADLVGAGKGDRVLLAFGSAARLERSAPIDAAIIAIVDEAEE